MNVLTLNRILEKGDEVFASGEWKPVPDSEFGLQVQFSKYGNMQIRRPSETLRETPETVTADRSAKSAVSPTPVAQEARIETPKPISPDSTKVVESDLALAAKAEANRVPASGVSPAGGESPNITLTPVFPKAKPLSETFIKAKPKKPMPFLKLPAVVSTKAHSRKPLFTPEEEKETTRAALAAVVGIASANEIFIPYPSATAKRRNPIWIGRNGTFNAKSLTLINGTGASEGIIKVIPHGARGQARNAIIEFPAEIIPQVVDFLLRHQTTPK